MGVRDRKRIQTTGLAVLAAGVFCAAFVLANLEGNVLIYAGGLLVALGIFYLAWRERPRYLLFALALYLPFEDGLLANFEASHVVTLVRVLPDAVLLLVFLYCAGRALVRGDQFFGRGVEWPLVGLLVIALISMVVNHIPVSQAIQGPYTMFRYAMVFYLAAASGFQLADVRFFVRALVAVAVFECLIALTHVLLASLTVFDFAVPQSTMFHQNMLGAFLALVGTLLFATYRDVWSDRAALKVGLALGLFSLAVMVLYSRQSFLALLVGLITVVLVSRRQLPTGAWAALGSSIAGAAGGFLAATRLAPAFQQFDLALAAMPGLGGSVFKIPPEASQSAQLTQTLIQRKSAQTFGTGLFSTDFYQNSRLYEISHAVPVILRQSPLFGLGPGTFGSQATYHDLAFYERLNTGLLLSNPHSTLVADVEWVTVIGQLGLLGVCGFLWLLLSIGGIGYRLTKQGYDTLTRGLGTTSVAFIPAFLFLAWFGPNFEIRSVSMLLWLIPGIALSLRSQEQRGVLGMRPAQAQASWLLLDATAGGSRPDGAFRRDQTASSTARDDVRNENAMPRICMINGQFLPVIGGAERQMQQRAQHLVRRGHQVLVLTYRIKPDWPRYEVMDGYGVMRTGGIYLKGTLRRRWGLAALPMFIALIRQRNHYDIIHAQQMLEPGYVAVLAGKLLHKPVILQIASAGFLSEFNYLPRHDGIIGRWMLKRMCSSSATVVALGRASIDEARAAGIRDNNILLIPNGVDVAKYPVQHHADPSAPLRSCVCVARLAPEKGVDVLVRAWKFVVAEHPEMLLRLVGDGDQRSELEDLCRSLGIGDNVRFVGLSQNVPAELMASDFLVLPSRTEGLSNALLEGMATGLPCVATNVGGSGDVIKDGITGLLVEPEDERALADAILRLVRQPDVARGYGRAARALIEENYSQQREISEYVDLYERLLGGTSHIAMHVPVEVE